MFGRDKAKAALRAEAEGVRRDILGFEENLVETVFWWVAHRSRDHLNHTLEPEHVDFLTKFLTLMLERSRSNPAHRRERIDTLLSRIDRGLRIDVSAEQSVLRAATENIDRWLHSTERLMDIVTPLFPVIDLGDDDGFVGDVYPQTSNLLERASDPHKLIEICGALLSQIDGSGVVAAELPNSLPRNTAPAALLQRHFNNSWLPELLLEIEVETKIRIPFPTRFEHTHVLGGTGHGKTQFLQSLILKDLQAALDGKGSLVVIDGQGDLIRTITRLAYFDPDDPDGLADKLVLIDANDVDYPVAINMFALDDAKMGSYSAADRERLFNATISLYEYFFGALLGADLTQRQAVIFKFLARLMFVIPDATIHTLLDVMENGDSYRPYIDKLDPTAQRFFREQFFNKAFDETKQQIATRLWGVISNGTLNRMFSSTENKFDFFDAINSGKIVLINTAKDLLQADGNAILGRFFIALLARAIIQRQVIPNEARRATFAYIDEIQDFIENDNKIEDILNQARKYKAGLICAHQNLEQLSKEQRASFAASTSTKFVGGLSAKDARALAGDMRTTEDFLLGIRKAGDHTNFACFVKNVTASAISVPIPFGQMEAIDTLSPASYDKLIRMNRERYCAAPEGAQSGSLSAGQGDGRRAAETPRGAGEFDLGEHDLI